MEASAINIHSHLIERCRNDDSSAQFEIYKLYNKAMFNTALRITGDQTDAEDVLQEAFVSAFQNLGSYRANAAFGAWLKKIVINKALNHIQKSKRDLMIASENEAELEEAVWTEETESSYSIESVKQGMTELPSGFRTVLSLYLFEGYDHKEISQIMNISESTSKTQYKRAKDKLRLILNKKVNYG